jgi:hypothetical protein
MIKGQCNRIVNLSLVYWYPVGFFAHSALRESEARSMLVGVIPPKHAVKHIVAVSFQVTGQVPFYLKKTFRISTVIETSSQWLLRWNNSEQEPGFLVAC